MAYSQPSLLSDALSVLQEAETRVVAGGTDFYPAMQPGQQPTSLLDITRIDGLSDITQDHEGVRFGAAVTWSDVIKADLPPGFDALKQAAREVGSLQIQNAGTVAGNICNASPAADGVPPLLALDAKVELCSAERGVRVIPLSAFITGVRQTTLAKDELVTAILVPQCPPGMRSGFEKLGSRRYLVISIVMTAANVVLDKQGKVTEARIAVGACSAVAQRLADLEADLIGQDPRALWITQAHLAPLAPIDDVRGSGDYRLAAAAEQIQRSFLRAIET
ncbi:MULTISPECIES: xanthine dehydrogenase family protein subunit M [unclassified Ruegeria]|uniref:FAD binding domain-containing protein n=1 Tax=unclassified Ruegeria TaxID=2625375 RepID=UPI0014880FFE|nr:MULTISPECIES: FAD binding domain-containing protein [unclassified Ruegeria]